MNDGAMRQLHESAGGGFETVNGVDVVAHYSAGVSAEYEALRHSVGVLDLSFRSRVCLTGADRVRFLHGQVTNDVNRLKPGQGCYAALVNAKGKIESDFNIYCLENELLLDFEPGLAQRVAARFEKFIIADDVQTIDVSADYGLLSIQGPLSEVVLREFGSSVTPPTSPLTFTKFDVSDGESYCMNVSRAGSPGFDFFHPQSLVPECFEKLRSIAEKHRGRLCGWQALEIARIEAAIPRFGQDMDETNLAPETGIAPRAISYTKGCYIGQEVISRIRAFGQVAKALRGLRLQDNGADLPARGDKILAADKEVGYITSITHSPAL
jgi:folate-binding protein YgfZ